MSLDARWHRGNSCPCLSSEWLRGAWWCVRCAKFKYCLKSWCLRSPDFLLCAAFLSSFCCEHRRYNSINRCKWAMLLSLSVRKAFQLHDHAAAERAKKKKKEGRWQRWKTGCVNNHKDIKGKRFRRASSLWTPLSADLTGLSVVAVVWSSEHRVHSSSL